MAIQYSRGCPFNCEFCDIIEIYGRKPRAKSPAQMVAELEQLLRAQVARPDFHRGRQFHRQQAQGEGAAAGDGGMERSSTAARSAFYTEASVNLADDAELLQMMKDASFDRVFLGIETPAEESLKEAQKMQNTHRSLLESVRRIQRYGMEVMAGFIVGFDNDPDDIFDRQVEFIQDSAIPLAMVGLLQALPGTQLYRRLQKEGRLVGDGNGNNLDFRLNFIPRMDPQRLLEGYRSILQRIYRPDIYYARVRRFLAQYQPHTARRSAHPDVPGAVAVDSETGDFQPIRFFLLAAVSSRPARATGNRSAPAIRLAIMGYHFQVTRMLHANRPQAASKSRGRTQTLHPASASSEPSTHVCPRRSRAARAKFGSLSPPLSAESPEPFPLPAASFFPESAGTESPSPGARNRLACRPCCLV